MQVAVKYFAVKPWLRRAFPNETATLFPMKTEQVYMMHGRGCTRANLCVQPTADCISALSASMNTTLVNLHNVEPCVHILHVKLLRPC